MNKEERETRARQMAEFRYSLIAELANPYLNREQRRALVRQKAAMEHEVPNRGRQRLTVSCLNKWLAAYRKQGMEGLMPQDRRDVGKSRVLSAEEAATLVATLESLPHMTATAVLRKLQADGRIQSLPSSSALSRLVRAAGLDRSARVRLRQDEQNLKFEFFSPLECVQVDCMYTFPVPEAKGKRRQAVLLAFLDDATRRILYASFGFGENSVAFENGIRHILAAHGRIGKLYADNGSSFVSMQTRRILDTLGIVLVHSRPFKPKGRGKIERFFRTVRLQFLSMFDPAELKSIQDLDMRFHSWLESEYHRSPHRGLQGRTPLDVWLEKAHRIIPIDPSVDLSRVFLHECGRKVHKDSTLTLEGVLYEVNSSLIGCKVTLRYDPAVPALRRRLEVVQDGKACGEARIVDAYANSRVRRANLSHDLLVEDLQQPQSVPTPPSNPLAASLAASRLSKNIPHTEDNP